MPARGSVARGCVLWLYRRAAGGRPPSPGEPGRGQMGNTSGRGGFGCMCAVRHGWFRDRVAPWPQQHQRRCRQPVWETTTDPARPGRGWRDGGRSRPDAVHQATDANSGCMIARSSLRPSSPTPAPAAAGEETIGGRIAEQITRIPYETGEPGSRWRHGGWSRPSGFTARRAGHGMAQSSSGPPGNDRSLVAAGSEENAPQWIDDRWCSMSMSASTMPR